MSLHYHQDHLILFLNSHHLHSYDEQEHTDLYSPLEGIPGIFSVPGPELGHGQGVRPQLEEFAVGLGPVNGREGARHALLIVLSLCR